MNQRQRRGASRGGALLGLIVVVLLVFLVVGLFRGWFAFSLESDEADNRVDMRVSVNKDRIREDTSEIVDESRELTQSAAVVADLESVQGVIVSVDASTKQLTLKTEDDEQLTVTLDDDVEIQRARDLGEDTAVDIESLAAGDEVIVVYHDQESSKHVMKITVVDDASTP